MCIRDRFQLSYGRRITRPNYGALNPFTYIFDDYTHEGGNTKLHPSFSDNIELGYVYRHGPVILCEKVDIKKVVLNKLELTKDCDNQRVKVCLHFWH